MTKGLTLFAWIIGCILLFFATFWLGVFASALFDNPSISVIAGFVAFVLPWCLLYGIATSSKRKARK
jgi:hypothetical protein